MKGICRKLSEKIALAVSVLVLMTAQFLPVSASEMSDTGIDPYATGSVTLSIPADKSDWYVEGAAFHIYKIADLSDDMTFALSDPAYQQTFSSYGTLSADVLNGLNSDQWEDIAESLIRAVREKDISDQGTAFMRNMSCSFTSLDLGLYLIQGDTTSQGNRTVVYQPVVICIPQRQSAYDDWSYDIHSEVKFADPSYSSPTPDTEITLSPSPENPGNNSPLTRDSYRAAFYGILLAADTAVIVFLIYRYRKNKDTEE